MAHYATADETKLGAAIAGDYDTLSQSTKYNEMLAQLRDIIFDGLPEGEKQKFAVDFHKAISADADLALASWRFLDRLLTRLFSQPWARRVGKDCWRAVAVIAEYARGEDVLPGVLENAADDAAFYADEAAAAEVGYAAHAALAAYYAVFGDAGRAARSAADAVYEAKIVGSAAAAEQERADEYRAQAVDLLDFLSGAVPA